MDHMQHNNTTSVKDYIFINMSSPQFSSLLTTALSGVFCASLSCWDYKSLHTVFALCSISLTNQISLKGIMKYSDALIM